MIACINTIDPIGGTPLPQASSDSRATKVRHITMFAASTRALPNTPLIRKLKVRFAEAAFTPSIRIQTK